MLRKETERDIMMGKKSNLNDCRHGVIQASCTICHPAKALAERRWKGLSAKQRKNALHPAHSARRKYPRCSTGLRHRFGRIGICKCGVKFSSPL